jgi:excisionase family DNA binding protein
MSNSSKQSESTQAWFTPEEAAKYLRVTRQTIYNYMKEGSLPYYELRKGRGRRLKKEDLDNLLTKPSCVE